MIVLSGFSIVFLILALAHEKPLDSMASSAVSIVFVLFAILVAICTH